MGFSLHNDNRGTVFPPALIASAIIGLLTLSGLWLLPLSPLSTGMNITPSTNTVTPNTQFTVSVVVNSATPVNAFAGTLRFDPNIVAVARIDYNTSIADLWAEKPWYNDGAGTITFAGGSTRTGGFTGSGPLLSITFTARQPGNAALELSQTQILQHDGFGTELAVEAPVDTFFTVVRENIPPTTPSVTAFVSVTNEGRPTDLNGDGTTSLGDISIFMVYLATNDERGDINGDGAVTPIDLSILLESRN